MKRFGRAGRGGGAWLQHVHAFHTRSPVAECATICVSSVHSVTHMQQTYLNAAPHLQCCRHTLCFTVLLRSCRHCCCYGGLAVAPPPKEASSQFWAKRQAAAGTQQPALTWRRAHREWRPALS
jgi:hypothetical protein